jgi:type 1 glutamine amidotransferase
MVRRLLPCLISLSSFGQNVLHYTETSGFDHGTRDVSLAMFQAIAAEHGLTITSDNDGSSFGSLGTLQQFQVIVFSNTSGDDLLDAAQRANFEAYIAGGGRVMGIHAASDTYRHSTANGSNTGTWDFYAELIGASVQNDPNHVDGTPLYDLSHIGTHASTANLPDPWAKSEEYYYWEGGYYRDDNIPVLQVEETVGPNGEVNSYDAPRPMSWYRELPEGGRVFYTALGHAASNYTDDALFRQHIEDALLWMIDAGTGVQTLRMERDVLQCWPNPTDGRIGIRLPEDTACSAALLDAPSGTVLLTDLVDGSWIDLSGLPNGLYMLHLVDRSGACAILLVH